MSAHYAHLTDDEFISYVRTFPAVSTGLFNAALDRLEHRLAEALELAEWKDTAEDMGIESPSALRYALVTYQKNAWKKVADDFGIESPEALRAATYLFKRIRTALKEVAEHPAELEALIELSAELAQIAVDELGE